MPTATATPVDDLKLEVSDLDVRWSDMLSSLSQDSDGELGDTNTPAMLDCMTSCLGGECCVGCGWC